MAAKEQEVLTTYVGDMHALVSHIYQAIDKQLQLLDNSAGFLSKATKYRDTLAEQMNELQARLDELGGSGTHPIKEGVAAVLGVAAGVIDKVRSSEVAKALRDDYTAINHAIIAYVMLLSTAEAAGDIKTAELAKRHLAANAAFVMEINNVMPKVVIDDLSKDGLSVKAGALDAAEKSLQTVWKEAAAKQ